MEDYPTEFVEHFSALRQLQTGYKVRGDGNHLIAAQAAVPPGVAVKRPMNDNL